MLSFIFRFIANCRGEKRRGPLDVQEINQAETSLIRIVQLQEFKRDIKSLKENNRMSAKSLIKSLNPFLDKDGVLRVGRRLCNSDLNFECKFPVILPCNHKLTNLIVEYFHLKCFHLGPQALLYQRSKWKFEKDNARVGDLVLIKEDNLAVNKWLMGRLIEVFPGKDNRIRVVTIKIQHGVVKRPISKLCILPMRE
ncbi:uncharacterized protein TNCV_949651 [Trichonephila clavipes]|nr:uncharacterized protein TNCV_949651 [Trichonephila clavipes]